MEQKSNNSDHPEQQESSNKNPNPPGYPLYPPEEDIFNKSKVEIEVDPEDISETKDPIERTITEINDDAGLSGDEYGGQLDVPGSELDDEREAIGNEDEENNYYSLGGDNHNDLEEDQGDS